jgi:hypothetical protein
MDGMLVGIVIGVALILIKIMDYFLSKAKSKENEDLKQVVYSARSSIQEDISKLKESTNDKITKVSARVEHVEATTKGTLDVVQKTDSDGTPLCYVPRSWADTQEKIVEALDNISTSQVIIAKTLENIEKNQNKRGD